MITISNSSTWIFVSFDSLSVGDHIISLELTGKSGQSYMYPIEMSVGPDTINPLSGLDSVILVGGTYYRKK